MNSGSVARRVTELRSLLPCSLCVTVFGLIVTLEIPLLPYTDVSRHLKTFLPSNRGIRLWKWFVVPQSDIIKTNKN